MLGALGPGLNKKLARGGLTTNTRTFCITTPAPPPHCSATKCPEWTPQLKVRRWEERAYQYYEGGVEEVYAHCHGGNSDSDGDGEALAMGAVDDAVMRDLDVATNGFGGGPGALPQGEGAVTNAVGCSPNDASVGDEGGVRGRTQAQTSQTMCRRATLLLLLVCRWRRFFVRSLPPDVHVRSGKTPSGLLVEHFNLIPRTFLHQWPSLVALDGSSRPLSRRKTFSLELRFTTRCPMPSVRTKVYPRSRCSTAFRR